MLFEKFFPLIVCIQALRLILIKFVRKIKLIKPLNKILENSSDIHCYAKVAAYLKQINAEYTPLQPVTVRKKVLINLEVNRLRINGKTIF